MWIEVAPDQLDKPLFFKSNINHGIGEGRIFGGAMTYPVGVAQVVVFHKVGQNIQLIAKNTKYTATPGTPEARAVAAGFSDSLLATAPISSQPHPTRKSILDRCQRAAARRPAGRRDAARANLSSAVRLRRAQLVHRHAHGRRRQRHAGGQRALRAGAPGAAAAAADAQHPADAADDAPRRAQHVHRLPLLVRQAARRA